MSNRIYNYLVEEYSSGNRVSEFGIKKAVSVILEIDNPSHIMVGEIIDEMVGMQMLVSRGER